MLLCEAIIRTGIYPPQLPTPTPPKKKKLGGTFLRWFNSSFCRPFVLSKGCKDMQLLESCKLLRSCEPTINLLLPLPLSVRPFVFLSVCLSFSLLPSLSFSLYSSFSHCLSLLPSPLPSHTYLHSPLSARVSFSVSDHYINGHCFTQVTPPPPL